MLQSFRDNMKGTMAFVIIGIMIIPFALFGVDSLFLQDNTSGKAAEVNGKIISEMDLSRAIAMQKQQLLERFGEQAPVDLLSDEKLRDPVLNRLIQRHVIENSAYDGGLTAGDAYLDRMILSAPQFKQKGKFSPELYSQLLRSSGYTPATYKQLLSQDIVVGQHISGISDTAFMTDADVETLIGLSQQTRDFYYITLPFADIKSQVVIADEQVKEYYDTNQPQFMTTEMVSMQYIELSLSDLAESIEVSEEEIAAQFAQDMQSFNADVTRQVAHILIEVKDDGSEQAVIAEIQAKLDAGEDFSTLATLYSDDLGSKEIGGDLGTTDGSTFPEPFESALAELTVGQVSQAVVTDAGFHFIKLLNEEKTAAPTLAERHDFIAEEIAMAQADSDFVELLNELPDATYNATDLAEAADSLGLEVKISDFFDRSGGEGIFTNNQILASAFDDEILHNGAVSDVIELGDDHVAVIRQVGYQPSIIKPLADVSDLIKNTLTEELAVELLIIKAESIKDKLAAADDVEELAAAEGLDWQVALNVNRAQPGYDTNLLGYIFSQAKPKSQPIIGSLLLSNNDYVVTKLSAVKAGKLPELAEQQKARLVQQLAQQQGTAELSLFESDKRALADVTVY